MAIDVLCVDEHGRYAHRRAGCQTEPVSSAEVRNARREAQVVAGDGYDGRVLEPSPPPVLDDDFADDPVAIDGAPGARVISPVAGGDLTWRGWLERHPHHAEWAAARWLGAYARLVTPPLSFAATRVALHRVAVYVVSPSRRRANGKIGLRFTLGGFGTPFFAGSRGDEQLRVRGAELIRQTRETVIVEPISTLNQASALALDGPPDVAWAEGFDGAVLRLSDFVDEVDQRAAALAFFRDRRALLDDG